jgi:hypothetical protein
MQLYAKHAKNKLMEVNCAELSIRSTRKLGGIIGVLVCVSHFLLIAVAIQ